MPRWIAQDTSSFTDEEYQNYSLQGVSRTFALTIPQLPKKLRLPVGNAYLLCRISDTIEDEEALTLDEKESLAKEFIRVLQENTSADTFSESFSKKLTEATPEAERDLVRNTYRAIRLTHSFTATQRRSIQKCVAEMATGMIRFQKQQSLNGLHDTEELDEYCYYVAGVVGVMLTELFCDYSKKMAEKSEQMLSLAVSFGQGLQMTNILKDIWEDQQRGACWLPRDIFSDCEFQLKDIAAYKDSSCFFDGLEKLIAIATAHLHNALKYTLLIPREEKGIRRFCFWAIGMAILTLRNIDKRKNFSCGQDVKISRNSVKLTILATELIVGSNNRARWLFNRLSKSLPTDFRLVQ